MATHHLAVEIDERRLRAVIAEVDRSGIRPIDAVSMPYGEAVPEGEAPAGETLRHLLKRRKIQPHRTVVILPRSEVMTRTVMLPSDKPDEIVTMAKFEAEKHIPFNAERHIVSHHVMRTEGLEGSEVFLAAVDRPVADRVLATAERMEFEIDQITVSTVASHAALLHAEPEAIRGRTIALVVVGAAATDISVLRDGELLISRGVPGGVQAMLAPLAEGESPLLETALPGLGMPGMPGDPARADHLQHQAQRIGTEIRRTQEFARREFKCPPLAEVLVTGEGAQVDGFAEACGRCAGIAARRVVFGEIASMCDDAVATPSTLASHFVCLGALLEPPEGAIRLDLTPPSHRQQRQATELRRLAVVSGALAALALILVIVYLKLALSAVTQSQMAHREQLREMRPRVEEMENMRTQINIIETLISDENSALAVLNHVSGLDYVPPRDYRDDDTSVRLALQSFSYNRDQGEVEIEGYARHNDDITRFRQDLESTGWFRDVRIDSLRPNTWPNRGTIQEFTIQCALVQPEAETSRSRGRRR